MLKNVVGTRVGFGDLDGFGNFKVARWWDLGGVQMESWEL